MLKMIRFLAIAFAAALATLSTVRAADPSFDDVIDRLSATESTIHRVKVKNFDATWETKPADAANWGRIPLRYRGTAWYDLGDKPAADWQQSRVWTDEMTMRWEEGRAPFLDAPVDLSWDGKVGQSIRLSQHTTKKGRVFRDNAANVEDDRPMLLASREMRYASGIGFTTQLFISPSGFHTAAGERKPLSTDFREAKRLNRLPTISTERIQNVDTIRLRWETPDGHSGNTFWFDPARGYALIAYEMKIDLAQDKTRDYVEVSELKEVTPGVWFPLAATMEMSEPGKPGTSLRMTYKAESVEVNGGEFKPELFKPVIPVGYMVVESQTDAAAKSGQKKRLDYLIMPDRTTLTMEKGTIVPPVKVADPERPE